MILLLVFVIHQMESAPAEEHEYIIRITSTLDLKHIAIDAEPQEVKTENQGENTAFTAEPVTSQSPPPPSSSSSAKVTASSPPPPSPSPTEAATTEAIEESEEEE